MKASAPLQTAARKDLVVVVVVVVVVAATPNYLWQASQNLGKYFTIPYRLGRSVSTSALHARIVIYYMADRGLHQPALKHSPFNQRRARALLRVELARARSVHPAHHRLQHGAQEPGGANPLLSPRCVEEARHV